MLEIPPNPQRSNGITYKLVALAILMLVSWVASLFVLGIVQERENRRAEAFSVTSEQWSRAQTIAGPILSVPIERTDITTTGEPVVQADTIYVMPTDVQFNTQISTEQLSRGIYDIPVYTATVHGEGTFDLAKVIEEVTDVHIFWDKAVVSVNVSDTRGIVSEFSINWNDTDHKMVPASKFTTIGDSGVHAGIVIDPQQPLHTFSFEMVLKGSEKIDFLPLGETTTVTAASDWSAPNFQGEFLPFERVVEPSGFTAAWEIASYGKNLPPYWFQKSTTITSDDLLQKHFGVQLHQAVDSYTMVDRATKYAILFISLTFLAFFMYEVLVSLRIHPIQYLLVGLALALFYLLLLSFSEVIGFLPAYVVSALATTLLITGYCFSILKASKKAFSIGALLLLLYVYLYILLQLETFSLLFGSVLLFAVLTTVMYITRNLNWYTLKKHDV